MRKLREVLRLKFQAKLTNRQIARSLGISASTVSYYANAMQDAQLDYEAVEKLDEARLTENLLPHCQQRRAGLKKQEYLEPDYINIHQELKRKGVNLQLLWEEHKAKAGHQFYSYSQFCRHYKAFKLSLKLSMRQIHKAGEKGFIDFSGTGIPIYHPNNTIHFEAKLFVVVLGASNYTFTTAIKTRSLIDWIGAHVAALNYYGGVPEILIPDNEKAAVSDACYYDPDVNPTYADFAHHYQVLILPTRPRHPKDKAKVEKGVQFSQTWILAKLRHRKFYSLNALNEAIKPLLDELNNRPFKQLPGTRLSQFIELEKPALAPLPQQPYEFATFKKLQVRSDYRICIDKHEYSVPYQFIHKIIDCRISQTSIEIFHQGNCIARHIRSYLPGRQTVLDAHMPQAHLAHQKWTPARFEHWAQQIGEKTFQAVKIIIKNQPHPEFCYRIHNGLRRLSTQYGNDLLEQSCAYALLHQAVRFKHIKAILASGMVLAAKAEFAKNDIAFNRCQSHEHIRGAEYFKTLHQEEE